MAWKRARRLRGVAVAFGALGQPVAELDRARAYTAVQSKDTMDHVGFNRLQHVLILLACVPRSSDRLKPLALRCRGGRVRGRPRHPRRQVLEVLSDCRRDPLGVCVSGTSQHGRSEVDALRRVRRHHSIVPASGEPVSAHPCWSPTTPTAMPGGITVDMDAAKASMKTATMLRSRPPLSTGRGCRFRVGQSRAALLSRLAP